MCRITARVAPRDSAFAAVPHAALGGSQELRVEQPAGAARALPCDARQVDTPVQEMMKAIAAAAVPALPHPGSTPDNMTVCFYINVCVPSQPVMFL